MLWLKHFKLLESSQIVFKSRFLNKPHYIEQNIDKGGLIWLWLNKNQGIKVQDTFSMFNGISDMLHVFKAHVIPNFHLEKWSNNFASLKLLILYSWNYPPQT